MSWISMSLELLLASMKTIIIVTSVSLLWIVYTEDFTFILLGHISQCSFQASTGNRLYVNLKGTTGSTLFLGTKQSVNDKDYKFAPYSNSPHNIYVNKPDAVLYYAPERTRTNWKVIVTLHECYFKSDGLCMWTLIPNNV